jgi:hypothetical protein
MDARIASIAVGLLVAGVPAFAQQRVAPKTAHSVPTKKPQITASIEPTEHTGTATGRNGDIHGNSAHAATVPEAHAAVPEAERRAIKSDLVWLGDYNGMSAEEFYGHSIDTIKAFQKRHNGKETGILSDQERALLTAAAAAPETAVGWRLIEDTATGAHLGVPEKFVPRASAGRTGSRWSSAQGQIQIETFRLHEASLPALFEDEKKTSRRLVGYSALSTDSFVITGEQRLKRFVVRAQSSGSEVRGVTILYDQATEGTMARVAVAVSEGFVGFPDPNGGPPLGRKRSVEYSTAIVVSGRGDLVALGQVTNECQFITVAGLGHVDRIAEDKTNDLALLRLYGARNLVPAPLAGDAGMTDAITLFGIADPVAQAGDGTVSSAAAQVTALGVEPAPRLGFSGAAAVDAQGRFAGIVELKAPVVAGAGSVSQQATLVPAAAVRAFLQAQGITLCAGHTAMDQSVVRIICVRK